MNKEKCSIGNFLSEECDKKTLVRTVGRIKIKDIQRSDQVLIERRTLYAFNDNDDICHHHEKYYLSRYESLQKYCYDPNNVHMKKVTKGLTVASDVVADRFLMKPGQKLCVNCLKNVNENNSETDTEEPCETDTEFYDVSTDRSILNESASLLGISPVKHVGKRDQISYAKQKAKKMKLSIIDKMANVCQVNVNDLTNEKSNECTKCQDMDQFVIQLKEKISSSNTYSDKIKLLTLTPESWSIAKTVQEFGVSEHLVKRARKVKSEKGLLGEPEAKRGHGFSDEIIKKVVEIYESDDYSRMCPGKKDCVSVKIDNIKMLKQKRLLLATQKDLYYEFKEKNPDIKIGLTKFYEYRPKWCVPVTSSGSHSVCVCSYHQNVKLMCVHLPVKLDYKDLINKIVCDNTKRDCMFHLCQGCPPKDSLLIFLNSLFEEGEIDLTDNISYKQWVSTGRTTLVDLICSYSEFTERLCNMIFDLSQHHYIKEAQSLYLRESKQNLTCNTCIILMDFAENYTFLIQDAIQGYYWQNNQATLHPFAIYVKDPDTSEIKVLSYCIISDHLKHDQTTVHCFVTHLLNNIKKDFPNLKHVKYFSDGAASQYKNYKALVNLTFHFKDHNLHAEHNFFATSHGKSPCDGIGGTIKREASRASLRATVTNQILTPEDLYKWSKLNIKGIEVIYISSDNIQEHELKFELNDRYKYANTVPGTRSFHCFTPLENQSLKLKRISLDNKFDIFTFNNIEHSNNEKYQPGQYIAFYYDDEWFVGLIVEVSIENADCLVKFMQRNQINLTWSNNPAQCWVLFTKIITIINTPDLIGRSGRQYRINESDYECIMKQLK